MKFIEAPFSFKMSQLISCLFVVLIVSSCSLLPEKNKSELSWKYLLDEDLSQWEVWLGVPHSSIKGLPEGTYQADNLNQHGDPANAIGLNNDIKNVFSMIEENGEPVLKVTGEIYGGITSKTSFENYHLSLKVKWGDKKWAPRLKAKRDSGLLFHCQGEHGAFWKTWKACQELQIQETDLGDFIPLAGPKAKTTAKSTELPVHYHPEGKFNVVADGYTHAYLEPDAPHGQWNTIDLYAFNDKAIFVVNNVVVMVITESINKAGEPLTSGQIQLQSEGAEVYYKDIKVKSIKVLPENL